MTAFHRTAAWMSFSRMMRKQIQAQLPMRCVDCPGVVQPWDKWQVGHIYPQAQYPELALEPSNVGPSHSRCNQRAGGRMGAARTNAIKARKKKRAEGTEYPEW